MMRLPQCRVIAVSVLTLLTACATPSSGPVATAPDAKPEVPSAMAGGPAAPAVGGALGDLFRLRDARTRRSSSADANWQDGNADARPIPKGQTLELADLKGPGIIRHIWFTIYGGGPKFPRVLTLRMYWDGSDTPAVESPLGDFFAVGHGATRLVNSVPVAVTSDAKAYNCYWPMPFRKAARITLTNDSKEHDAGVYWYIDYEEVPSLPTDTAYFHAQYRQEYPCTMGQDYLILDAVGRGHYVGTVQSAQIRTASWFGEGDDRFYIDGASEPTLRGTGTEDYFCDAWGYRLGMRPYYGITLFDGYELGDRVSTYRWHIHDPVHFTQSLKVTIEHKGVMFDTDGKLVSGFHERQDLMSSVAFWYQTGQAKRFASVPPIEERLVPERVIEVEASLAETTCEPADTQMMAQDGSDCSGGKRLFAMFAGPEAKLTVPFTASEPISGVARLKLTRSWDYGIWKVSLDGKVLAGLDAVDLFNAAVAAQDYALEFVELTAGQHMLAFECVGRNPESKGYFLGADAIVIESITPYAVPPKAESK
ncbi:MAG: DUF2961 domain-containing protein [Phycisphaerae bacterium]|nr:DUF2961 domain-containing protein [Phycisphaerae bacterium]